MEHFLINCDKRLSLHDFKTQVGCMLEAISQFNTAERTEAFGYLQECVTKLESNKPSSLLNNVKGNSVLEEPKEDLFDDPSADDYKCHKCSENFDSGQSLLEHLQGYAGAPRSCLRCKRAYYNVHAYRCHFQQSLCSISDEGRKQKQCPRCPMSFARTSQYNNHLAGHERNDCRQCEAHFAHRKHLESHMLEVHNARLKDKLFCCQFCDKSFVQKRSLFCHYRLLHAGDRAVCQTCGEFFDSVAECEMHQQSHNARCWICDICGEKFSRKQQYVLHAKAHDKYKCELCSETFTSKKRRTEHERAWHVSEISNMPTGRKQLTEHSFERELSHRCNKCSETFALPKLLKQHIVNHHSGVKKIWCGPCMKSFTKNKHYCHHMLSKAHSSDDSMLSRHQCQHCMKTFPYKQGLRMHLSRVHVAASRLKKCQFCSFSCKSLANLNRHLKLHVENQQFICEKCGAAFHRKSGLTDHNLCVHSQEKNYSCEKCGRSFKLMSILTRHMVHHSDQKDKICHCGQSYKLLSHLKRHQLMTHKVEEKGRIQRFVLDEMGAFVPVSEDKKKKKHKSKLVKIVNDETEIDPNLLLNAQSVTCSPSVPTQDTVVIMASNHESQLLEVSYHNLNYQTEATKQHLVYEQSLDMASLQVVEKMLQDEDVNSLKEENELIDALDEIRNTDTATQFLNNELIHPPIETSLVTSLEEPIHDSSSQVTDSHLGLITSLPVSLFTLFPNGMSEYENP